MDNRNVSILGMRSGIGEGFKVVPVPFGIEQNDRLHHIYILGKTGTGKSTLLRNLMLQDIEEGRGFALLDPLGDLADELLDYIPPWRTDHVVNFNPADTNFPVAFNLLQDAPYELRSVIAAGVVGAFKHIYEASWGDRLEWILINAVYALLECPGTTLLGVTRMLQDKHYRTDVLRHVTNPIVRSYWLEEFPRYGKEFAATASSPVQNKVGQFIIAPAVRNIIGQVKSTFDVPFMMDNERIFIANLSKGTIGEKNTNLLGSLLATSFQLTAMRRARIAEADRIDFHLYIDEFHNFTTRAFASALSEVRKYRLSLVLAHQYLNQLDDAIRDAVIGNCGSLITFKVGSMDAQVLARELTPMCAETLVDLGQYEVCAKLLESGESGQPFIAKTLPPLDYFHGRRDVVCRRSRRHFTRPRAEVEGKISRWMTKTKKAV